MREKINKVITSKSGTFQSYIGDDKKVYLHISIITEPYEGDNTFGVVEIISLPANYLDYKNIKVSDFDLSLLEEKPTLSLGQRFDKVFEDIKGHISLERSVDLFYKTKIKIEVDQFYLESAIQLKYQGLIVNPAFLDDEIAVKISEFYSDYEVGSLGNLHYSPINWTNNND